MTFYAYPETTPIRASACTSSELHQLRGWPMFSSDGHTRRKQEEAQTCQAGCLNLMTNAVVVWNTFYMQEAPSTCKRPFAG